MQLDGQILASFLMSEENENDSLNDVTVGKLELNLSSTPQTSNNGSYQSIFNRSHKYQKVQDPDYIPNPISTLPKIIETSSNKAFTKSPPSTKFGMDLKNALFGDSILKSEDLIPNSDYEISYELIVATLFIVLSNKRVTSGLGRGNGLLKKSNSNGGKRSLKLEKVFSNSNKENHDHDEMEEDPFRNSGVNLTPAQRIKMEYKNQN